jgi:hypothetical protein
MAILFLLIGLFFFGVGALVILDHYKFQREAIEATGWVKGYKVSGGGKNKTTNFYPVIRVSAGKYREFQAEHASNNPAYLIGDQVKVYYKEGDKPRLKSNVNFYGGSFFIIFGFVFVYIFYATFSLDLFTLIGFSIALFFGIGKLRKTMHENGLHSWEDLKTEYLKWKDDPSNMKFAIRSGKKDPEPVRGSIITTNTELYRHKAEIGKKYKIMGPVIFLIGAGIFVGGFLFLQHRYEFMQIALPAMGTVVELEESYSDDSYVYYPIVEYAPPNSYDLIRFRHNSGSNPPSYRIGEEVDVLFDPDDVNNAMIDSGLFNYFLPTLIIFFGFIFLSVGWSTTRLSLKRKKYLQLSGHI